MSSRSDTVGIVTQLDSSCLAVRRIGAVLALIMAVQQRLRDLDGAGLQRQCAVGHLRHGLQHHCVVRRIVRRPCPTQT